MRCHPNLPTGSILVRRAFTQLTFTQLTFTQFTFTQFTFTQRVLAQSILAVGLLIVVSAQQTAAQTISYTVPAGTVGTQNFNGSLGMDFDVNSDIEISRLGVFDSGSDGLSLPLRAHIYDRNNTTAPVVTLNFATGSTGALVDGSRFLDLKSSPLVLPAGFEGTIVAEGYAAGEPNGNVGTGSVAGTTDDGGGAISFVGNSRFGPNNLFPGAVDGGPANLYHAGTFEFQAATQSAPRIDGAIAYVVPEGTVGNQVFGGSLGMDFDVTGADIAITHLGVFDSGSDGLATELTARLYDRSDMSLLATLSFTPNDPGNLIDGSRFKELDTAIALPQGFQGTIVAEGYNSAEPNGNAGVGTRVWSANSYNVIDFVGGSRFGAAGSFPSTVDGGPVNRYAAGTFQFSVGVIPEPTTLGLWSGLGLLASGFRRRR